MRLKTMTPKQLVPDKCIENRLRYYREKAGLSQEKLARMVNVSRQTIIAIEKGKYYPSLILALILARIFKVKVEDLFKLKEDCQINEG